MAAPDPPPKAKDEPASAPDLSKVDSAWDEDEFDEDATMVAQVPKNLVALSRLKDPEKTAPPREEAPPEKHEAITARPPPMHEPLVMVDAPHEQIADAERPSRTGDEDEDDEEDEVEEEDDGEEDDFSDAAEGDEEARARAADEAAGLDAEARRKAVQERAAARREKARARKLAARERRKDRAAAQRLKQKQPKKRSTPPPPKPSEETATANADGPTEAEALEPTSREQPTLPPAPRPKGLGPRRDMVRMVIIVAVVIALGALVLGLMKQ
jgi:hypothetical protein